MDQKQDIYLKEDVKPTQEMENDVDISDSDTLSNFQHDKMKTSSKDIARSLKKTDELDTESKVAEMRLMKSSHERLEAVEKGIADIQKLLNRKPILIPASLGIDEISLPPGMISYSNRSENMEEHQAMKIYDNKPIFSFGRDEKKAQKMSQYIEDSLNPNMATRQELQAMEKATAEVQSLITDKKPIFISASHYTGQRDKVPLSPGRFSYDNRSDNLETWKIYDSQRIYNPGTQHVTSSFDSLVTEGRNKKFNRKYISSSFLEEPMTDMPWTEESMGKTTTTITSFQSTGETSNYTRDTDFSGTSTFISESLCSCSHSCSSSYLCSCLNSNSAATTTTTLPYPSTLSEFEKSGFSNTESSYVNISDHEQAENYEVSKTLCGCCQDPTVMYTRRTTPQCWERQRTNVQCACSHKGYRKEREFQQAKTEKFMDALCCKQAAHTTNELNNQKDMHFYLHGHNSRSVKENTHNEKVNFTKNKEKLKVDENSGIRTETDVSTNISFDTKTTEVHHRSRSSNAQGPCKAYNLKQTASLCDRYEAQQKIIAIQHMLLETQKKIIQDLEIENSNKDAKISAVMAEDQRKASDLHTGMKEKYVKEDSRESGICPVRYGKAVNKMEERKVRVHTERQLEKRNELLEQQRSLEEERERIDREIMEKRRSRIETEKRKQIAKKKIEVLDQEARKHYELKLVERYGLSAFKGFITEQRENAMVIKEYYLKRILIKYFYNWLHYSRSYTRERLVIAREFYNVNLMRKGLSAFLKVQRDNVVKEQVAREFHDKQLLSVVLKTLKMYMYHQHFERNAIMLKAEEFHERKLLEHTINAWKLFPNVLREEREKKKRKKYFRRKV